MENILDCFSTYCYTDQVHFLLPCQVSIRALRDIVGVIHKGRPQNISQNRPSLPLVRFCPHWIGMLTRLETRKNFSVSSIEFLAVEKCDKQLDWSFNDGRYANPPAGSLRASWELVTRVRRVGSLYGIPNGWGALGAEVHWSTCNVRVVSW